MSPIQPYVSMSLSNDRNRLDIIQKGHRQGQQNLVLRLRDHMCHQ